MLGYTIQHCTSMSAHEYPVILCMFSWKLPSGFWQTLLQYVTGSILPCLAAWRYMCTYTASAVNFYYFSRRGNTHSLHTRAHPHYSRLVNSIILMYHFSHHLRSPVLSCTSSHSFVTFCPLSLSCRPICSPGLIQSPMTQSLAH